MSLILSHSISQFQKHLKPNEHVLRNPGIGDICIVECEGQLFRCEIVDMADGEESFVISYVDYGEEQELSGDSLYAVDNQEEVRDCLFVFHIFNKRCNRL